MKLKLIPFAVATACTLLALHAILSSFSHAAGPLVPPGAPEPTMVSLQELSDQLSEVQTRLDAKFPGGDLIALQVTGGTIAVWNDETNSWSEERPGGTLSPPTISNSNVMVVTSNNVVTVWNDSTKSWQRFTPGGTILEPGGTDGNFFFRTSNGIVAAWNKETSQWDTESLSGTILDVASSQGQVAYINSNRQSAIWTPKTGVWVRDSWSGDLTVRGTDE